MPEAAVEGAIAAAREGIDVVLVGERQRLESMVAERGGDVAVEHAGDVIGMEESAADARRRKDASVMVAARLVREGRAGALVSMGHSGATMTAALFGVGRVEGVERPAIVANMPTDGGFVALVDAGANAEARAAHLRQFAVMGSVYAQRVFERPDPSVGLMSIGEEPSKGTELVREAHALLRDTPGVRFYGNVEGRDLFRGTTDVVVTDGFTGNVVLKLAEGEAEQLFTWIARALRSDLRSRLGGFLARPALRALARRLDPDTYGAQPLLGVAAPVFIGHGSSDAKAVLNALRFARTTLRADLVPHVRDAIARLRAPASAPPESS